MEKKVTLDVLVGIEKDTEISVRQDTEVKEEKKGLFQRIFLFGPLNLCLLGAIIVFLGVGVGWLTIFWFQRGINEKVQVLREEKKGEKVVEVRSSHVTEAKMPQAREELMITLPDFIVPLPESKETLAIISLTLELHGLKKEEVEEKLVQIRNLVYEDVRQRSAVVLKGAEGRRALREKLVVELNELLGGNAVTGIYFNEFLLW